MNVTCATETPEGVRLSTFLIANKAVATVIIWFKIKENDEYWYKKRFLVKNWMWRFTIKHLYV